MELFNYKKTQMIALCVPIGIMGIYCVIFLCYLLLAIAFQWGEGVIDVIFGMLGGGLILALLLLVLHFAYIWLEYAYVYYLAITGKIDEKQYREYKNFDYLG